MRYASRASRHVQGRQASVATDRGRGDNSVNAEATSSTRSGPRHSRRVTHDASCRGGVARSHRLTAGARPSSPSTAAASSAVTDGGRRRPWKRIHSGSSHASGCSVNLRSLQTGMTLYAANSGMRLSGLDWGTGWRMSWIADDFWEIWWGPMGRENIKRGLIWPYVKAYGFYLCPTFEGVCRRPPAGAEWRPGVPYAQGYSGWGGAVPSIDPGTFDPVRSYSLNEHIMTKTTAYNLDMSERVWLCDENPWRQLYLQDDLGGCPAVCRAVAVHFLNLEDGAVSLLIIFAHILPGEILQR